jgi:hypothetical protein
VRHIQFAADWKPCRILSELLRQVISHCYPPNLHLSLLMWRRSDKASPGGYVELGFICPRVEIRGCATTKSPRDPDIGGTVGEKLGIFSTNHAQNNAEVSNLQRRPKIGSPPVFVSILKKSIKDKVNSHAV